jgi:hypothetical protein
LYPATPLPGESQYQYDGPNQTWVLQGKATGVVPGCYGDSLNVGSFCVDATGRITSAINTPIAVTGGTVTDVTAGVGLLGGTITTSGTIDLDTAYTDGLYLSLTGGTMTGDITFAGTQTFPGVLPLAGGTMTGDIVFSGTQTFPPQDLDTVTTAGNSTTNAIDVAGLEVAGIFYPLADGVASQVMSTDGAGNLGWLTTAEVVAVPGSSAAGGVANQIAFGGGNLYFHDGTQWWQVAGSTF